MAYSAIRAVSAMMATRMSVGAPGTAAFSPGLADAIGGFNAHELGPVGPEAADRGLRDAVGEVLYLAAAAHLDDGAGVLRAARGLLHDLDGLAVFHAHQAGWADEVGGEEAVAHHFLAVVCV